MNRRTFFGCCGAAVLAVTVGIYQPADAQANFKAIVIGYEFSDQTAPAGQLNMLVQYLTYGTVTARGAVRVTIDGTDTATGIRTKILDAVVADITAAHKVTIPKSDILFPTYAPGS